MSIRTLLLHPLVGLVLATVPVACGSTRTPPSRAATESPALVAVPPIGAAAARSQVTDLSGRPLDPLAAVASRRATVLLFITTDCPVSNGYAPEIQRLYAANAPRGIAFFLVYPDPELSAAEAKRHEAEYGHTCPAALDPKHELVRRAGVDTTPEAAVFMPDGAVIYRGRINDQYVDFGKSRPAPTVNDLRDVLDAIARGQPPAPRTTPAIGCPIPL